MPVRFFRLIKNLTADGYYTSRVGLLEELGYIGNKYRPRLPASARCRSTRSRVGHEHRCETVSHYDIV